jgi:DNA-binding transcriptional MocR family regulator
MSLAEGVGDRVLNNLNTAYEERCRRLCEILQTEPRIQIDTIPLGGYFLWVTFSGIDDTTVFLEYCEGKGVKFLPGKRCDCLQEDNGALSGLPADACQKGARLCFADMDLTDIEQGAELLVTCYREYVTNSNKESASCL